jgi:carbon monoxide dehydrogenase subunit G
MTSSATRTIEIDAPIEEVFAFVADPRRQTEAMARALERSITVSEVETSPEGIVTGWTWSTRWVLPITARATRTEHIVNQRIVNKHDTATKDVDTVTFEPTQTGTRLTWHAELSSPIPLLEGLLARIGAKGRSYERQIDDILIEIKREVEGSRKGTPAEPAS